VAAKARGMESESRCTEDPKRTSTVRVRLAVAALLLTHWLLAVFSVRDTCTTFDEITHLTAGVSILKTGDFRLDADHPPPIRVWAALPCLIWKCTFPDLNHATWWGSNDWEVGRRFFYECGNDTDAILFRSRAMMALLSVGLGALVYAWSKQLFGRAGGLISLTLYAFSPSILANAPLVTGDLAVTGCFLGAMLCTWRVLHQVTWSRVVFGAVSIAGLLLCKMSSILILPMIGVLLFIRLISGHPTHVKLAWIHRPHPQFEQLLVWALVALTQALIVILLIWAAYGFRYEAMKNTVPGRDRLFSPASLPESVSPWEYTLAERGIKARFIVWARDHRVLPEAYLYGLSMALRRVDAEDAFLNGETRPSGWWYYYPYCLLVKSSLTLIVILVVAGLSCVSPLAAYAGPLPSWARGLNLWAGFYRVASLWTLLVVYSTFAMIYSVNLGDRLILPVYPPLFILAGRSASCLRSAHKIVRGAIPVLLGAFVVSSVWTFPHYLAHFNYLIGGPRHAYKHLVDSSLDWGQDLPGLKRWLDKNVEGHASAQSGNGLPPVYFSYFGTGLPSYYGIHARIMSGFLRWDPLWGARLTGGVYCISATMLHQLRLLPMCRWTPALESCYRNLRGRLPEAAVVPQFDRAAPPKIVGLSPYELDLYFRLRLARLCAFLRQREPYDNVGYSILIYRLSDQEVWSAVAGRPAELVPDHPDNLRRFAESCFRDGVFREAAVCYEHLFKANPRLDRRTTAELLGHWGSALLALGRLDEASQVFRSGLESEPKNPFVCNNLAWILATAPAEKLRDGGEALRLAKTALEVTSGKDSSVHDTLAAAYAELGQFDEARREATIALELASKAGDQNDAREIAARLELYKLRRPYRAQ